MVCIFTAVLMDNILKFHGIQVVPPLVWNQFVVFNVESKVIELGSAERKMKAFKKHVKEMMERNGWQVSYVEGARVHLCCIRRNSTIYINAYGNGHGHIYRKTLEELKSIAQKVDSRVLVAKVTQENHICLNRLNTLEKMVSA